MHKIDAIQADATKRPGPLERELATASAALARTTAAYHCLRSALAIHAGDPPSRQALERAELIRKGAC